MVLIKKDFIVGQKVKGYGLLNEYGEFEFIPEQTGLHKGRKKLIKEGEGYTLSETTKMIIIHISFCKGKKRIETIVNYVKIMKEIFNYLNYYDF